MKTWILLGAFVIVAPIGCSMYNSYTTAVSVPSRVLNKTLETNNVIENYEYFYDAVSDYNSRLSQITSHSELLKTTIDESEKNRLNIELGAMKQSCREIANNYNVNSQKINVVAFKSKNLPEELSAKECEL